MEKFLTLLYYSILMKTYNIKERYKECNAYYQQYGYFFSISINTIYNIYNDILFLLVFISGILSLFIYFLLRIILDNNLVIGLFLSNLLFFFLLFV